MRLRFFALPLRSPGAPRAAPCVVDAADASRRALVAREQEPPRAGAAGAHGCRAGSLYRVLPADAGVAAGAVGPVVRGRPRAGPPVRGARRRGDAGSRGTRAAAPALLARARRIGVASQPR